MSPTKTEEQFQTTAHRPQHSAEPVETRGMKILRDRAVIYKGLCSNCENLEQCTYPSTTSETWYCEEYSFAKAEPVKAGNQEVEVQKPEPLAGLCMNCEVRESCKFPKPAGGVWFCGEYQ